jgi:hypothetical protein
MIIKQSGAYINVLSSKNFSFQMKYNMFFTPFNARVNYVLHFLRINTFLLFKCQMKGA